MKKIIILLFTVFSISTVTSQTAPNNRTLVYSENENALVFEGTPANGSANIIIKTLPSLSEDSVPVKIILTRGNYTLSKSADLAIPFDYRVYVEDTWTEKNYNLNSS